MKLRSRLLVLLALLLASTAASLVALNLSQRREAKGTAEEITREHGAALTRILRLMSDDLQRFAWDYSLWDEMVTFVEKRDPQWATVNIDASLMNWKLGAAWVLQPDATPIYGADRLGNSELRHFPIPAPEVLERVRKEPFPHFFWRSPAGLMEVSGAPIQPSNDDPRETPAQGWFFVGKIWDETYLKNLAELTESRATLEDAGPPPTDGTADSAILIRRELPGWDGKPVAALHLRYSPALLQKVDEYNRAELLIFLLSGLIGVGAIAWCTRRWVIQPLQQLGLSLATGRPEPIEDLASKHDEFAHVAVLVRTAHQQQAELRREVDERLRAEAALLESIEERNQLARDLHDGVIQSIYATGLTLEGIAAGLRRDPSRAEEHLQRCTANLNRIIEDLRHFIARSRGGPACSDGKKLPQALSQLLDHWRGVASLSIERRITAGVANHLPPEDTEHVLHITREALSNALRHGRATAIVVALAPDAEGAVLEIRDNGIGFDPGVAVRAGHGLDNMVRRAEEIGASLQIEARPGHGATIRVELPMRILQPRSPSPGALP